VLEDSHRGLQAAHAANIDAVWIRTALNSNLKTDVAKLFDASHVQLLSALKV
jgi:beta-phosphoglucomutase-like phosphatase (HAD superfamily)